MLSLVLTFFGNAFRKLFELVSEHPYAAALLLSLAANVWLCYEWRSAEGEIDAIHAAQGKATAAQVAANHQPVVISTRIAEESNREAPAYYERVRVVARDHIVRSPCAPGNSGVPGTDSPAPLDDRPVGSPELVSVARDDWDKLLAAAARLAKVRQDAEKLIAEGAAVSSDGLPEPAFSEEPHGD